MFKFMLSTTQVFIVMYCSRYLHVFGFIFINQEITSSFFFFYIGGSVFQCVFTSTAAAPKRRVLLYTPKNYLDVKKLLSSISLCILFLCISHIFMGPKNCPYKQYIYIYISDAIYRMSQEERT
jgi:hypothetical protein